MPQSSETISSYRDLRVWKDGMDLAEAAYRLTISLPREEKYGMTAQIRRSAASIPANIAEGYGRDSRGSYIQHLRIAQGSLKELETHLLLAVRVSQLQQVDTEPLLVSADGLGRMLRSLIRSLEAKAAT
jgi:four helix bundle protein